jgi:hypothetical protein
VLPGDWIFILINQVMYGLLMQPALPILFTMLSGNKYYSIELVAIWFVGEEYQ